MIELNYEECLEFFIAAYRSGLDKDTILYGLDDLSKEWDKRELPCRVQNHQRPKKFNPELLSKLGG
jgi:hypothetical protein